MSKLTYRKLVEDLTERGVAVTRIDPREMFEPGTANEDQTVEYPKAGADIGRIKDPWAGTPQLDPGYMLPSCCAEIAQNIVLESKGTLRRLIKPAYRYIGRVENYDVWERKSYGHISHEQYQRFPLVEWVKVQA